MATYQNLLKLMLWNATTNVRNKTLELHKFLTNHNTNMAIVTETWLTPINVLKFSNYNIYRKDQSLTTSNNPGGEMLLVIRKNIPAEDIPQPFSPNIEYISIILKTTPTLLIGAAYVPPKIKILQTDVDNIISAHKTEHFFIGGNFNAKHRI